MEMKEAKEAKEEVAVAAAPPARRRPQTSSTVQTTQKLAASMDRLTKRQNFWIKRSLS